MKIIFVVLLLSTLGLASAGPGEENTPELTDSLKKYASGIADVVSTIGAILNERVTEIGTSLTGRQIGLGLPKQQAKREKEGQKDGQPVVRETSEARPAVNYTCLDTEPRPTSYIVGNITVNSTRGRRANVIQDRCVNATTVREYFCANSTDAGSSQSITCISSYVCLDGACVARSSAFTCQETDNRIALNQSGVTIVSISGSGREINLANDTCRGNQVQEYYCANATTESISSITASCPLGQMCLNGQCERGTETRHRCFDSDLQNSRKDGWVTILSSNGEAAITRDTCFDARTVTEYYCNANNASIPSSRNIRCAEGDQCANHLCIPRTRGCFDQEHIQYGFNDAYVAGSIHNSSGYELLDTCEADGVREYYCKNQVATNTLTPCSAGETCVSGACRPSEGSAVNYHCFDSDNGINEFQKGQVAAPASNGTTFYFHDQCLDQNILIERSCTGQTMRLPVYSSYISCWPGQVCRNGACVLQNGDVVLNPPAPVPSPTPAQRGAYLYANHVVLRSGVVYEENALDEDADYATLQFNIAPGLVAVGGGFHRSGVSENVTATNIVDIQVNLSELNLQCSHTCTEETRACTPCSQDIILEVRSLDKCMGATSYSRAPRFIGFCYAGDNETAQICTLNLGTQGCPSGKWDVNYVAVSKTESIARTRGPAGAVHWIRLEQVP